MKCISTINFKGGVGKTTITWLLSKYLSEIKKKNILFIDTDAQMSLTVAFLLQQENNRQKKNFTKWYHDSHRRNAKTLLHAMKKLNNSRGAVFDFEIDDNFIYTMNSKLHFIPSVSDLYWLLFSNFTNTN